MNKLYLLIIACCLGLGAGAQTVYRPNAETSFTGGSTYCTGATMSPLTLTFNTCNIGMGSPTGVGYTIDWYYNTTNSNLVSGASTLASGTYSFTTPALASVSHSYTPSLPVGGDYYFFCVVKWNPGSCTSTVDTFASSTQLVRVMPAPITGPASVCIGASIALSNMFPGGTWMSGNPSVMSIHPTTGVATGASGGGVFVTYTVATCTVNAFLNVNDNPPTILPATSPLTVCQGTVIPLTNSMPGGTWTSSASGIADVGVTTGFMTAVAPGNATITYTNTTTGCYNTKTVSVSPAPAAITGNMPLCTSGGTSSVALSNATTPGTWSSSNSGIASVNSGTGVVTPGGGNGTATITYTHTGTGCRATTIVTVSQPPLAITGPNEVCAGSSITLANARPGGAWTTAASALATVVSGTGVVTGVSNGNVNISYTTPGCVATFKNITVNALPGTITGALSVCYGQSVTLTSTVSGGTWVSDDTSVATIDTNFGIVTGHVLGTAVMYYKVSSGCMTSATVTVNPLAPILGSDSVCVGSEILLTNIVGGGTWVSSNPAIAEADTFTGVIHGLINGITYIGYMLPTGCATTFFLNVIPPLPTIAGPLELCSAVDVVLSNGVGGGTWSTSNMYVAEIDAATGTLTGRFPDTATVSYTIFGCITHATVTVDPLPTPTLTYNWAAATLSTSPFYASYQWYDSTIGAIPGATNNVLLLPQVQKSYYVRVTDAKGCAANTEWFRFPLGMNTADMAEQCHIFPNPAISVVHIEAPVKVKAVITSVEGKVLSVTENATEVDISRLAPGFYLIGLYDETGQLATMQKLTKQ